MGFRVEGISTPKGRLAPDNLKASYLLSAGYDGKQEKAFLRLYEPESQQIYLWYDNTGHMSYCISKLSQDELENNRDLINFPDYRGVREDQKFDAIAETSSGTAGRVESDTIRTTSTITVSYLECLTKL